MKSYCMNLGIGLSMFFCDIKVFYVPLEEKQKYINVYSKKKR